MNCRVELISVKANFCHTPLPFNVTGSREISAYGEINVHKGDCFSILKSLFPKLNKNFTQIKLNKSNFLLRKLNNLRL